MKTISEDYPTWEQRNIAQFSDTRRETVSHFLRELRLRGASPHTVIGYIKAVRSLGFDGKPYEALTSEDLMTWMEAIGSNGWSKETINLFRKQVKHFLRVVHGCKSSKDPTPEPVRCITRMMTKQELPKNILSRSEVRQLIDACQTQRDRALVFCLYESGARAGEILGLKVENVEFDRFGAVIHIQGKTGGRRIRIIESVPDLRLWFSMHPGHDNANAPLWPTQRQRKGPLGITGLHLLLERLCRETEMKKHIYPHLLRHTRATHLANVLTEAQMREFFGWTKSSDMPEVYVHLSGRDVDETLLKHYGIKVEMPEKDMLEPKCCPWCKTLNSPSARFCQNCNSPLEPASAMKAAEKQKLKMDLVERFIERIREDAPGVGENILREMKEEIEAADSAP